MDTTFVNGVTLTDADWFNDVNRLHYDLLFDPTGTTFALTTHKDTEYTLGDASVGGCLLTYSQISTHGHDLVLVAIGAADIHIGKASGGTGVLAIDMDIVVTSFTNDTRAHGLQILQEDNSAVIEFPMSGGIIDLYGQLRGGNGANDDLLLQIGGASGEFKVINSGNSTFPLRVTNAGVVTTLGSANFNGFVAIADGIAAPGAAGGAARIYVDTADGDLKVVFGDGTIKTLATDT